MRSSLLLGGLVLALGLAVLAQQTPGISQSPPLLSQTPAEDPFPDGCIDCHKARLDIRKDYRLSRTLDYWNQQGAEREFVNIAKTVWTKAEITGKHPVAGNTLVGKEIPTACINCHQEKGLILYPAIHLIHLSTAPELTGFQAPFVTNFGGQCTHCHVLVKNGEVEVKRGLEPAMSPGLGQVEPLGR